MEQGSTSVSTSVFKQWEQKSVTFTYSIPRPLLDGYFTSSDLKNPNLANLTTSTFDVTVNGSQVTGLSGISRFIALALSSGGIADVA